MDISRYRSSSYSEREILISNINLTARLTSAGYGTLHIASRLTNHTNLCYFSMAACRVLTSKCTFCELSLVVEHS